MSAYHVPLIIRGKVIEDADVEFGGRRVGAHFTTPDVNKHVDQLVLSSPSALGELYQLSFDDILDFLRALGDKLAFERNVHLQRAFELSIKTSGLGETILRNLYRNTGKVFDPGNLRTIADNSVGIAYLEGWVKETLPSGAHFSIRAFGARSVHVLAGNVPSVSALSIARNALLRSDAIFKTPSNDPLTAAAIARTMIDLDADHPLTKHVSVAYWKGGDVAFEEKLYQPRNIEKIVAWGGFASIKHIARYIQPGIDLITLDPKLSSTIIGRDAFVDTQSMMYAAEHVANDIGMHNQEGCVNARVVYVESGTDEAGLAKLNAFGKLVFDAIQALPPHVSTPAVRMDSEFRDEIAGLKLSGDDYKVIGCGAEGGVIVSQIPEPVDFSRMLANRIGNLVPIDDVETAVMSVNAYTQTIGVYPESLKAKIRDRLAWYGAQRIVSLGYASQAGVMSATGVQDAIEPMRRMCKWVVDEDCCTGKVPMISKNPPAAAVSAEASSALKKTG
jgi:Acyl-CoA reductase (LuxC)